MPWTIQTWLAVGGATVTVVFTGFNIFLRVYDRRAYDAMDRAYKALELRVKALENEIGQLRARLIRWHYWYTHHVRQGIVLPDPPEQVEP